MFYAQFSNLEELAEFLLLKLD